MPLLVASNLPLTMFLRIASCNILFVKEKVLLSLAERIEALLLASPGIHGMFDKQSYSPC